MDKQELYDTSSQSVPTLAFLLGAAGASCAASASAACDTCRGKHAIRWEQSILKLLLVGTSGRATSPLPPCYLGLQLPAPRLPFLAACALPCSLLASYVFDSCRAPDSTCGHRRRALQVTDELRAAPRLRRVLALCRQHCWVAVCVNGLTTGLHGLHNQLSMLWSDRQVYVQSAVLCKVSRQ